MTYRVKIDHECPASEWWAALRASCPRHALLDPGTVATRLARHEIDAITRLPGWNDGPEYARHPLVIEGD